MTPLQKKSGVAAFALLSLSTTLAGCTPTAVDPGTDPGTDAGTSSGTYTDGTYTESGDYQAPSGTETVEVTLTLADGIITDVTVVGEATDPTAQSRQAQFSAGIADIVVGVNIDDLNVQKVGGSSLTSGGFNVAVEAIKADAAA